MSPQDNARLARIGFVGVGRMGSAMLQRVLDAGAIAPNRPPRRS
jgi:hypothetical protein